MDSLNNLSNKKLINNKFKLITAVFFVVFGFIGFVDATYLTINHFQNSVPNCHLIGGCQEVLFSAYSTVAGVPVALGGVFYYLTMLILTIHYFNTRKDKFLLLASKFTVAGLLASLYFVYLQIFVIKSFCQFCMLSAFVSMVLFVLGMVLLFKNKKTVKPVIEMSS